MPEIQEMGGTQEIQEIQESPGIQGTQEMQGTEGIQEIQAIQEAQGVKKFKLERRHIVIVLASILGISVLLSDFF